MRPFTGLRVNGKSDMLTRADSNELWFPYSKVTKQWIVYTEALIHH